MTFIDKQTRHYRLKTQKNKDALLDSLQERISNAKKKSNWFSLANITINYKRMTVDSDHLVIDREGITANSYAGKGAIDAYFKADGDNTTIIEATITPQIFASPLWVGLVAGFLLILILINYGLSFGLILFCILALAIVVGIAYASAAIRRYRLENYLTSVLLDIGIEEESIELD
jgi:hypothetical protein